ncbi:hypothetical protein RHGRI_012740 [Rhododendron griersonianum]|uniref:Uncharacterized protein n=1 Tax=Rhododendron griersonianum TaxID=479676 RepID=A0AAV6KS47_9ERIC|nr:hypothetical protein RHGRI_012740 [Rhododendron griersonianum]
MEFEVCACVCVVLWAIHAIGESTVLDMWFLDSQPCFCVLGIFFPGTTAVLRRVILLAGILTSFVVISSTLYTFWAAKNGCDFHFLGPFLFTSLLVLIAFALIQGTDNLIKRFNYDEYIWAAISLYLDILNLFLALLRR